MTIDQRPSSADKALASAVDDARMNIGGNSNAAMEQTAKILNSGIENATRPLSHLYVYQAWIKTPESRLPTQPTSVQGRLVASDWIEALEIVNIRMAKTCLDNKLPEGAYEIYMLGVKEIDLPVGVRL